MEHQPGMKILKKSFVSTNNRVNMYIDHACGQVEDFIFLSCMYG